MTSVGTAGVGRKATERERDFRMISGITGIEERWPCFFEAGGAGHGAGLGPKRERDFRMISGITGIEERWADAGISCGPGFGLPAVGRGGYF